MAVRKNCSAEKCLEYKSAHLLEVFHLGEHTCQPKPLAKEDADKFLKENIWKFGTNLWPKELAEVKMSEELRNKMST